MSLGVPFSRSSSFRAPNALPASASRNFIHRFFWIRACPSVISSNERSTVTLTASCRGKRFCAGMRTSSSCGQRPDSQVLSRANNYPRNARAAISISLAHFALMLMSRNIVKARVRGLGSHRRSSSAPVRGPVNPRVLALHSSAAPWPSFLPSFRYDAVEEPGTHTVLYAHVLPP